MIILTRLLIDLTVIRTIDLRLHSKSNSIYIIALQLIPFIYIRLIIYTFIFYKGFYLKSFIYMLLLISFYYTTLTRISINPFQIVSILSLVINIYIEFERRNISYKDFIKLDFQNDSKDCFIDSGNLLTYLGIPVIITKDKTYANSPIPYVYILLGLERKSYGRFTKVKYNGHTKQVFIIYDEHIAYEYIIGKIF